MKENEELSLKIEQFSGLGLEKKQIAVLCSYSLFDFNSMLAKDQRLMSAFERGRAQCIKRSLDCIATVISSAGPTAPQAAIFSLNRLQELENLEKATGDESRAERVIELKGIIQQKMASFKEEA